MNKKDKIKLFLYKQNVKFIRSFLNKIEVKEGKLLVPENLIKTFELLSYTSLDKLNSVLSEEKLYLEGNKYYSQEYYDKVADNLLSFIEEPEVVPESKTPTKTFSNKKKLNRFKARKIKKLGSGLDFQDDEHVIWEGRPAKRTFTWLSYLLKGRVFDFLNYLWGIRYVITNKRIYYVSGILKIDKPSWEHEWIMDTDPITRTLWQRVCGVETIQVKTNDAARPIFYLQNIPNKDKVFSKIKTKREKAREEKGVRESFMTLTN